MEGGGYDVAAVEAELTEVKKFPSLKVGLV